MPETSNSVDTLERLKRNMGLMQAGSSVVIDISTPAGQKAKFRTTFIGYLPKQYVLIQSPETSKLGNFGQYLKQGAGVTVRGLIEGHEGAVVAFISSIKQTLQIPSRILVLDFPKTVSVQNIRSSVRIDTDIDSKIRAGKEYWQASIVDISVKGCQLVVNQGDKLALASGNEIELIIEDFQGLTNLKLKAEICNSKSVVDGISMGLKFAENTKDSVTKLIYHAISIEN